MSRKIKSRSIAFRLAMAFIVTAILQSVLLASLMIAGGVLDQTRKNQYKIFAEKVNGRKDNLINEMNYVWTNFERDTEQITRYFDENGYDGAPDQADQVLEDLAPLILDALYHTKTTGAFFILPGEGENDDSLPALYFRNMNPDRNYRGEDNIYMHIGPWNVAEKQKVATTANWTLRLKLDDGNRAFYDKPYQAALKEGKSKWLGYWSTPFIVNPQDDEAVTYSVPLFGKDGRILGIFGVEISVDYMYRHLPALELQPQNAYGYIIGIRRGETEPLELAVTHGAMQKRMINQQEPLTLEPVNEENSIFRLKNHNSGRDIYACVNHMGMYYSNTPFANEEWYLIGLIDGPSMLQLPMQIADILNYSLIISLCLGVVIAVFMSRWFTKHSQLMEISGLPAGAFEIKNYSGRVLMTSQVPRLLGLSPEQERKFCKDKKKFLEYLDGLKPYESEKENLFLLEKDGRKWWLKISRKRTDSSIRGVIEDVTDDVLQTEALVVERDKDGLTGVKNRMAFQTMMEHTDLQEAITEKTAFVMCDLNDLKGVNDVYGHEEGDGYIIAAAEAIRRAFGNNELYRTGGDEFVAVVKGWEQNQIDQAIRSMETDMKEYSSHTTYHVAIAAGVAFCDLNQDVRIEGTLSRADADMYRNKKRMKSRER
ncbi:diguanylate cyclase [Clostridium sp. AM58-1XD]|uniref:sensor domain-containing diguanylate cyclase n=1 Tax=Clostridium sp. AM58-1XD TaxID=2292307 RepID=UPI000E4FE16D|nr:diguanylate cyclase [Clostridium sp. AM58-1XD]RGY96658.1 diguanylate cyclase [Clostridium sp. AM58-1XD]